MYKYIIMGIQGVGKGTQAKLLCQAYDFVHISLGDLFRWHIANHTQLAAKINRIVLSGRMVDDDMVTRVLSERLSQHDWNYGFVLDGFPRNFAQTEFLFENYNINGVIHLDAPDSLVTERMSGRRVCSNCGLDYNLVAHPPKVGGICNKCGGTLIMRSDDHPDAIKKRVDDYHQKTEPMLRFFKRLGVLYTVNATESVAKVHENIRDALSLPKDAKPLNSIILPSDRESKGAHS